MTYKLVPAMARNPHITSLWPKHSGAMANHVPCPASPWLLAVLCCEISSWCSRGPCQPSPKAQDAGPEAGSSFIISALIGTLITLDNQLSAGAQGNPDNLAEFWTFFIVKVT